MIYLWLYEYYVDEENNKVMFNILVSKLFAFVLSLVRKEVQRAPTH